MRSGDDSGDNRDGGDKGMGAEAYSVMSASVDAAIVMSSSTVTYTSISSNFDLPSRGFHLMDPDEFEVPHSPKPAPPSPDYVPGPEYSKYVAPSNDEVPVEDQPLPADASPTALSPGY
nr:hypothetical protein [Tanacetum cinerariifolium]